MSVGAWKDASGIPRWYRWQRPPGFIGRDDPIDRYAVRAIQKELTDHGAEQSIITGLYNWATRRAVIAFQHDVMSLGRKKCDGVVGPAVSKALFANRVRAAESDRDIPDNLVCSMLELESAWDPGATGYVDPQDRGLAQINSHWHPEVSDDQAFDPAFSVDFAAKALRAAFEETKGSELPRNVRWDVAIAHHNNPEKARIWAQTGEPPDEEIARYVDLVRSRC